MEMVDQPPVYVMKELVSSTIPGVATGPEGVLVTVGVVEMVGVRVIVGVLVVVGVSVIVCVRVGVNVDVFVGVMVGVFVGPTSATMNASTSIN
jgi:hypothetical protein